MPGRRFRYSGHRLPECASARTAGLRYFFPTQHRVLRVSWHIPPPSYSFTPSNDTANSPLPLPGGPIKVQAQLPGNLKVDFQYETRSCQNATNVFTPVRNTDCSNRFNAIIAFAASSANLNCPGGGFVHAGTDCDEATRPICFTFTVS